MAEQVNQRIEDMINELEQMRRTNLFDDEEIRDISRKRKEFEYRIQRRIKEKADFVQYIAYELALLEEIATRRKEMKLAEKKKDIEYSIAKRITKSSNNSFIGIRTKLRFTLNISDFASVSDLIMLYLPLWDKCYR
ncbi:hypothetical protein ACJJTC_004506 [Scirpophaga incertulas]